MHRYSNDPLPSLEYLQLLGTALYVFNNTNTLVIETILKCDRDQFTWNDLIDRNSGNLRWPIRQTIAKSSNVFVEDFEALVGVRNRIAHSYQILDESGQPVLAARDHKTGEITVLTSEYLANFIEDNKKFVTYLETTDFC